MRISMPSFVFFFSFIAALTLSAQQAKQPSISLDDNAIVAVVDGAAIRTADVDAFSRLKDPKKLFQLNQQLYDMRQKSLDEMVRDRLLVAEARSRNLSVQQMLASLPIAVTTDAEIQAEFDQAQLYANPGFLPPDLASIRPMIKKYLDEQKMIRARAKLTDELKARASKSANPVVIRLQPPREAIAVLQTDPVRGSGPIEMIEFSDFQCPYCKQEAAVLKEVLARFGGQVRLVWKDYPLPNHAFAIQAAEAARCAHTQGKFWEYHDMLFANQDSFGMPELKKYAMNVGLDEAMFAKCLDGHVYRNDILSSVRAQATSVVQATPTIFINGRVLVGSVPFEAISQVIAEELAIAKAN